MMGSGISAGDIFKGISSIVISGQQASQINLGGQIAQQGALLSAQGYRQSARTLEEIGEFNLSIDATNNLRKLKAMSRQFSRILGQQTAEISGSGLSSSSKSFIAIRNESLETFNKTLLDTKVDMENDLKAKQYELDSKLVELENSARITEWKGEVSRQQARQQAKLVKNQGRLNAIFSLLG